MNRLSAAARPRRSSSSGCSNQVYAARAAMFDRPHTSGCGVRRRASFCLNCILGIFKVYVLLCTALEVGAPDAAGRLTERDVPALRPRLQRAVERYGSVEVDTMDCAYPNRKQWWSSLSPDGIRIVYVRSRKSAARPRIRLRACSPRVPPSCRWFLSLLQERAESQCSVSGGGRVLEDT
jgi:hypothetical protein